MNHFVAKPVRKKVLVERMAAVPADLRSFRRARLIRRNRTGRPAGERRNAPPGASSPSTS